MPVDKTLIKEEVEKFLKSSINNTPVTAGIANGEIKRVVVIIDENCELEGAEGRVAVFYRNMQQFTNYQELQTTRPLELISFELTFTTEDDEGQQVREFDFWLDLTDDFDSIGDEWKDKKSERMSDSEFLDFWM